MNTPGVETLVPIVAARIEGIGMLVAFQRPDWRAAPRTRARLTIRVVTDSGETASCLWFLDGHMTECEGLDETKWKAIGAHIHELLLERTAETLMARRKRPLGHQA